MTERSLHQFDVPTHLSTHEGDSYMRDITRHDWLQYFPFSSPRDDQADFITFALNAFVRDGKRFVIGDLPTGIGKSAIAVTIARYFAAQCDPPAPPSPLDNEYGKGAYILTTQKILQEQYVEDFQRFDLESIKSSSNYSCKFYVEQSCAESLRVLNKVEKRLPITSEFAKTCKGNCTYKEAKTKFLQAQMGVTNFSYFLAETMYGGALKARELLVIDEAHNVEAELAKFVALKIETTDPLKSTKDSFKCTVPVTLRSQQEAFDWVKIRYVVDLKSHIEKLEKKIAKGIAKSEHPSRQLMRMMKENEFLDKHICKVNRFIENYNPADWVLNVDAGTAIEFKPVDVSYHADWYLFKHAPRVLILSATIIDHEFYCHSLGISLEQMAFKACDSPFPAKNRPVHYLPVGKMAAAELDKTLPHLVSTVKEILEGHKGEKGLVHVHSYKIMNALRESSLGRDKRCLFQTSGEIREKLLWEHSMSPDPTVIFSPSMTEGVDLRDDLSRFQIFCKIPFPYMGDAYVKRKMERSPRWYAFVTARTIVQAAGRSIRNEKDWAVSYILDGSWEWFLKQNRKLFPKYFLDSLT